MEFEELGFGNRGGFALIAVNIMEKINSKSFYHSKTTQTSNAENVKNGFEGLRISLF
ncbi:MAG: hypothetical protein GY850_47315 [bacterium]|nr:hypothetical protein [bacterium]